MAIDLNSKAAFISAVKAADKPFAFLLGSPLSQDAAGGVPGIEPMLDFVREEIQTTVPSELSRFESELNGRAGADAYQTAMKWLQANLTQDAVNRVVARAVLQARRPGAPVNFPHDGVAGDWHLPGGTRQIAELIVSHPERFPGPILTTNFDPLLHLALEAAGGRANPRVLDSDGSAGRGVERRPGITDVVHLHGYWRDSDTLHTPVQLTGARPKLKASLQNLLRQRTLIVAAYGGWDDVFTAALADLLNDEEAKQSLLWCFYDDNPVLIEASNKRLFDRVAPAITRGRFLAYGGIDCHSIFAEIGGLSTPSMAPKAVPASPLTDWEWIDAASLAALPPLRREEILRYFDGAVPTWRHAVSDSLPRRQAVAVISERLRELHSSGNDCSMQLIRAAGGEGKTTVLLQAAADAARSGDWTILWRPSHQIELSAKQVVNLDAARQWLIVADDAETLIRDLSESARRLHNAGHTHVHFLLSTRDADWRFARGDNAPWEQWLNRHPDIVIRGIAHDDALAVVEAWRKFGSEGLRELAKFADPARQVLALETAVKESEPVRLEGSLFGGLLDVRFGQKGLQSHVRTFLHRLKDIVIEGGNGSLFDALLYIAACHGGGIPGINEKVLSDLAGISRDWVLSRIVRPLGEEAAAVAGGEHIFTRHGKVAAAILVEAELTFGTDLAEVWRRIVRQTTQTGREPGLRVGPTFSHIIHAGPRLQRALPQELSPERRKTIALAAALASVEFQPEWLGCVDSLARTYRNAGDSETASNLFRSNLDRARDKVDYDKVIRAYWYEWSVCEGNRGKKREHTLADAWVGGLSLSDHLKPVPITAKDGKLACAGLGIVFGKLARRSPDCPYAKARRAATYLGRLTGDDPRAAGYFNNHDREADEIHTPKPKDIAEAIAWLTAGVAHAGKELRDPFLLDLARPEKITFHQLRNFLSRGRKF